MQTGSPIRDAETQAEAISTRERWDCAAAELAQAQRAWQHANEFNRLGEFRGVEDALNHLGGSSADGDSLE